MYWSLARPFAISLSAHWEIRESSRWLDFHVLSPQERNAVETSLKRRNQIIRLIVTTNVLVCIFLCLFACWLERARGWGWSLNFQATCVIHEGTKHTAVSCGRTNSNDLNHFYFTSRDFAFVICRKLGPWVFWNDRFIFFFTQGWTIQSKQIAANNYLKISACFFWPIWPHSRLDRGGKRTRIAYKENFPHS